MRGLMPDEIYMKYIQKVKSTKALIKWRYLILYRIFSFLEPIFIKLSDIVVVVSDYFKIYISEKYKIVRIRKISTFSLKHNNDKKLIVPDLRKDIFKDFKGTLYVIFWF